MRGSFEAHHGDDYINIVSHNVNSMKYNMEQTRFMYDLDIAKL
jgi:hypothetical protein